MVDVSDKDITRRTASAQGTISVSSEVMDAVIGKTIKKGDVLKLREAPGGGFAVSLIAR